ncbi:hypothetical protein BJX76DRAFT_359817 [Aspergillus varians]
MASTILIIFTVPIPVVIFFLLLLFLLHHSLKNRRRVLQFATAAECLRIIDGFQLPDNTKNQLSPHEARALQNKDLKEAFGIHNAFTTDNAADAKQFTHQAAKLIKLSAEQWGFLRDILYRTVSSMPGVETSGLRIHLTPLTQALALRSSLYVLFKMRGDIEIQHLIDLGEVIHRTWMDIQRGKEITGFKNNHILQARLSAVFPSHRNILNPRRNPFNHILPSFETLWPVVLRLFLELHLHERKHWKEILIAFAQKPAPAQFTLLLGEDAISAEFLVKEGLRLYPPTRQICRTFQFPGSDKRETFTADVEGGHLDRKVWGRDALEFKPGRWRMVKLPQTLSFLAFGARPFLCPASQDFGPRVVGLIVGILLDVLGDEWVVELEGSGKMEKLGSGGVLRNDQDAYDGVFLVERSGWV